MSNFDRVQKLMDRLEAGSGKNISSADTLMALIKVGTEIGENEIGRRQNIIAKQLDASLNNLSTTFKDLDYTQTSVDVGDKPIYQFNRDNAVEAQEQLKELLDIPYINDNYGDSIDVALNSTTAMLAYQDTMYGQRVQNIEELKVFMEKYDNLIKSDPLLGDKDSYTTANELVGHITAGKEYIEKTSSKEFLAAEIAPLNKVIKEFALLSDVEGLDMDRTTAGIQVDMHDEYSPHLESFLRESKIIAGEEISDEGYQTLELPKDKERVSIEGIRLSKQGIPYGDALSAYDKWETAYLGGEAKRKMAPDYEIFDKVEQYVADPAMASVAMLIGHGSWGDTENTPLESLPAFQRLGKIQNKEGKWIPNPDPNVLSTEKLQKIVIDSVNDIEDRDASGKFRTESNALQNKINTILPNIMRQAGKTGGIIDSDLANEIEFRGKTLNEDIDLWNSKYIASEDMDLPNISVLPQDAATLDVVTDSKIGHVELFENFIKKEAGKEWWWQDTALSADPTGNIKTLIENPDAPIEAKWALMYNLTTEFLYSGGSRKRSGDVDDMFDGDTDRMNLFYNTLKSFQKLMEAEPIGTPDLKSQIGIDIEDKSAMEKTTGLSGLSGLLLNM